MPHCPPPQSASSSPPPPPPNPPNCLIQPTSPYPPLPLPTSIGLEAILRYRKLLAVEDTFRTTKALFSTRPIFHKLDATIRGHMFCSFLAVVLRKSCRPPRRAPSRQAGMAGHRRRSRCAQRDRGRVGRPPSAAANRPGRQLRLCRALGITLPPIFRRCRRSQTSPIV